MSLFWSWHDFAIYPLDTEAVRTEERRLRTDDASIAVHQITKDGMKDSPMADIASLQPFLVQKEMIVFEPDDEFEAMEVTPQGGVTIWTKKNVWMLLKDRGIEKMRFSRRHPPSSPPTR